MEWNAGFWSIIPPILAIACALITKEVYFSLMLGILSGTAIYAVLQGTGVFGFVDGVITMFGDKMAENIYIILFLCLLGILVNLIAAAGGSRAYGDWAGKKLKGKRSASLATSVLDICFFIDDYFNCLTVGTVMRPVTDKFKISREKLAYLIDATAAPVCIIAPVSTWAASVISNLPAEAGPGMQVFLSTVPMNLYAILTLIMVFSIGARKNADYGPMALAEMQAERGEIHAGSAGDEAAEELAKHTKADAKGKVIDLVLPIIVLIVAAVFSMLYYGGLFTGETSTLFDAFGNTSSAPSLAMGGMVALIFTFIFYIARGVLSFKDFFGCIEKGVKSMVGACLILSMAWALGGVCRDLLNTGGYVSYLVETSGMPIQLLAPIIFLVGCALAFATGTSWGTFSILIPIVTPLCLNSAPELLITCLGATLAGAVFGDHCSPISDTTILASTGSNCNHMDHVRTQIPYAGMVAICCFVGYIVAGFTSGNVVLSLGTAIILEVIALIVLPKVWGREKFAAKLDQAK